MQNVSPFAGSSTIHSANPIASSTFSPASAIRFRMSSSDPPPSRYAVISPIHGSIPSYPAEEASATIAARSSFCPRTVLVLRQ